MCDDPACASGIKHRLVTAADVVGHFTSVMIGVDSNPFIRHQNQTDGDLELYACDDPTCASGTNQTLLTDGSVGRYSSVAIGVDGNPVISHQDAINQELELAIPMLAVTGIVFE